VILVAGLLTHLKQPMLAVETLPHVVARLPKAWLVFAGDERIPSGLLGRLERRARELGVGDRVRFLGFIPTAQMPHVYAAADLQLHVALGEPFGMVLTEAMAMGKPVVTLDSDGPADIVENGVTGRIVASPGRAEEIAQAVVEILSQPAQARAMGEAGRRVAHEKYGAQLLADRLERICARFYERA
jgi:glycosyltransferase involved in cell wall biosynthesis